MIRLVGATVSFAVPGVAQRSALSSVNMRLDPGEWVALVGSNGSGKTTLLRAVAGLVPLDAGTRAVDAGSKPVIGMVLQEPDNQFVTSSVLSELHVSVPRGLAQRQQAMRVARALESFSLTGLTARNPHQLSGGEKQRLALATVWLQDPDVVLLDEPAAFLDSDMTAICVEFVAEMKRSGAAVLWATPGGDDIARADRVMYLDAGRLTFDGTPVAFGEWARESGAEYELPPVELLARELGSGLVTDSAVTTRAELAELLANADGELRNSVPSTSSRSRAEEEVRFEAVSFAYGDRPVFEELDLPVHDCLGVTGPNASGKTTLLLLAAGAYEPQSGRIVRRVADGGVARRVVYLPQSPERMFFAESVAEEIAFGPRRMGMSARDARRRSVDALTAVGFSDPETILPRAPLDLSTGEMRRVAFAVALALDPHFVLFDEPTAGLDSDGRRVFRDVTEKLCEADATVAIASHDATLLCETCDRIVSLGASGIGNTIEIVNGDLIGTWPEDNAPLIVQLQDELASEHNVDIRPRAARARRLAARLGGVDHAG